MHAIKLLEERTADAKARLAERGGAEEIDRALAANARRKAIIAELEALQAQRNRASKSIAEAKRQGQGAGPILAEMQTVAERVGALEREKTEAEAAQEAALLRIPNLPDDDVPPGKTAAENRIVRSWGAQRTFDFAPRDHEALGAALGLFDNQAGADLTGSGWTLLRGRGARVQRALIQFFLDTHTAGGQYEEIFPPYLVSRSVMQGTGQLPKFEEDLYRVGSDDLFLIPTAEVPVTNLYRNRMLDQAELPIRLTAYTSCFRREAGSYGKETRGLLRLHQFEKVELVKLCAPADSPAEHETLLADAERLLQRLELHYRVVLLCRGDMGFAARRCYDLEVYAPGLDRWLEVSSVSNFGDFQARRMNLRFRPVGGGKPEFCHTLNGSGLALPRVLIALWETHQEADGGIRLPEVLRPYLGGAARLEPGAGAKKAER